MLRQVCDPIAQRDNRFAANPPHCSSNTRRSSSTQKPRVLVSHQGCIPIYRKPFFVRLNENSPIDFVVIHGRPVPGSDLIEASSPFPFPQIEVTNRSFAVAGRSFVWQPVVRRALRGEFDGAVIGDEVKFLSNFIVAAVLWALGRPVVLWGFGYHQYDRPQRTIPSRATAFVARALKGLLHRVASGYLVYTDGGEQALRKLSPRLNRIAVLKNTVDTKREAELRSIAAREPIETANRELGSRTDSIKLLYFGRLVPTKYVELLIDYARRCVQTGRFADILIFGKGAAEEQLRLRATGLPNVVFHHHDDDLKLARALRISSAVVIPGYVGLAVTHAFAHGVPVLTRAGQMHSPEIEYLEHGVNGLLLPEPPDEFFTALDRFVDDADLRKGLAAGAERAAQSIDIDHMVDTFRSLVADCLAQPRHDPNDRSKPA
jgi:glycosyltransferase involved in cell wall biosynthesis